MREYVRQLTEPKFGGSTTAARVLREANGGLCFGGHPMRVSRAGAGKYQSALCCFEHELLDFVKTRHGIILETIRDKGTLPDNDGLDEAVKQFAEQFEPSVTLVDEPDAEAQADAEGHVVGGRAEAQLPEVEIERDDEDEDE